MQGSTHVAEHIDPRTARSRELLRDALAAEIDLTGASFSRHRYGGKRSCWPHAPYVFIRIFRDIPDLVSQVENRNRWKRFVLTWRKLLPYILMS